MADSGSDAELVRAILQHLVEQQDQGRPAREVWAASMTELQAELARTQADHRSQGARTDLHAYNVSKLSDRSGDGGTSAAYLLRRHGRESLRWEVMESRGRVVVRRMISGGTTSFQPRYDGLGDYTEGRHRGSNCRSPSSYSRQPRSFCRFRSNGKLPVGGLHVPVRSISLVHALAPVKLCARRAHDPLLRYRSRA